LRRLVGPSSILVLAMATAACAQQEQPAGIPLLGARLRTKPPSSDGSCRFDLTGTREETAFFVLGVLDEYLGRHIVEDDDLVEGLYAGDSKVGDVLRRQLQKLASEQGLDPAIREERDESGRILFRSKPIADRINSCYRYQMTNGSATQGRNGDYVRMAQASLRMDLFMTGRGGTVRGEGLPDEIFHRRRALAYLAGAWTRYRRGEDFVFANSKDKATLVAQLLTSLGCHRVSLESTFGYVPGSNTVRFVPTGEVREWLGRSW
jgi:hypothetical protein